MQFITDLRFIAGLYAYLDKRLRLIVSGFLAMVALPFLAFVLMVLFGAFTVSDTSVALDSHKPVVRKEPRMEYVPQPPAMAWPARGAITAGFGVRTPAQRHHSGIDIGGHYGDPITPYRAGTVTAVERRSSNSTGLGQYVMVDHGSGVVSVYGHLSSTSVLVGQRVTTQTVIGKEGSTGQAYGVHLHFEIRVNGKSVDPRYYVGGLPPKS